VVGYNYTENRYAMDHQKYPARILYGSENGQSYDAWKAVLDNDYIFGQFLWTGIDYLGESHRWPSRGFTSGLIDLAGYKKPRAWFRESLWSDKPMIYIGTYRKTRRDRGAGADPLPLWNYKTGDTVMVVCYTNCQQAQLILNGQKVSEPKDFDKGKGFITWEIPFDAGKLEVLGVNSGLETVRFAIETSKRPYGIQASALSSEINAEGGVALVEVRITDEEGNPVILADDEITCTLSGPAKLLGLEASNPADMGDYTDNRQRVYQGKMMAYIKATGKKGLAKVRFESPWLKGAEVDLTFE
jgi:beta-galactosidase